MTTTRSNFAVVRTACQTALYIGRVLSQHSSRAAAAKAARTDDSAIIVELTGRVSNYVWLPR